MKREQGRDDAPEAAAALPKLIALGALAAERENSFRIPVAAAEQMRVMTDIDGAHVTPEVLPAGSKEILLTLPKVRAGVLFYGALILQAAHESAASMSQAKRIRMRRKGLRRCCVGHCLPFCVGSG